MNDAPGNFAAPDDVDLPPRPVTRGDCANGVRPCPWSGCRHHLLLTVRGATPKSAGVFLNHDTEDPSEIPESCALDIADAGPTSRKDVSIALGVTHEMVRQIEVKALYRLWYRATGLTAGAGIDPDAELSVLSENDLTLGLDYAINEP